MRNRWIRELFSFSRKERTGIIGLLLIIFLLIIAGKVIPLFIPEVKTDFSKWEGEVNAYLNRSENPVSDKKSLNPESFDPNSVDSLTLANMGIPTKVAANWLKYLGKGGKFRDKEGVKRIFGMTPGLYEQLDSYIIITHKSSRNYAAESNNLGAKTVKLVKPDTAVQKLYFKKEKSDVFVLELNSTDSVSLLKVPGIGSILASRIIRYRNLLGGFYSVTQIREVYGLREEGVPLVTPYLTVDPSVIRTFNINFSTIQEMGHHPYIGYKTAKKLLRLRDTKGKFLIPDDLAPVVTSDSLKRLVPYLKFL